MEQTFAALVALAEGLDAEQRRAVVEGLTEGELALFDLLARENLSKADRERLNQTSRLLLARLHELPSQLGQWTRNAQTFTDEETTSLAHAVYDFVRQQSEAGSLFAA